MHPFILPYQLLLPLLRLYYYFYYYHYYYYYYYFLLMLLLLGLDSSELITQLRAAHASGYVTAGLDVYAGAVVID